MSYLPAVLRPPESRRTLIPAVSSAYKGQEKAGEQILGIEAHLRVWQTNPDMFRAKKASACEDVFRHRIPIYGVAAPRAAPVADVVTEDPPLPESIVAARDVGGPANVETTMSDERTRNLVGIKRTS